MDQGLGELGCGFGASCLEMFCVYLEGRGGLQNNGEWLQYTLLRFSVGGLG